MEFKRKDLTKLWGLFESLKSAKTNIRTTYTIARNKNLIQPEIDAINSSIQMSDELKEYESSRIELCKQYAKKNEAGEPEIRNGNFIFEESSIPEFQNALIKLQSDKKDVLEKANEQEKQLENLLEEAVNLDLVQFDISNLSDDLFNVEQLELLDRLGLIKS